MSEQVFEISATQLGELSQRWTCPRCFWVRSRLKGQLPYQQFPAVFSQIDRFSKDLIKQSFDRGELQSGSSSMVISAKLFRFQATRSSRPLIKTQGSCWVAYLMRFG